MSSPADGDRFGRALRDAHSGYHSETRRHHTPDALVDDVVTWPMLSPHLMRARLFLIVPTVLVAIRLVLAWFASMSSPDAFVDALISLLGVAALALYVAGIASLFAPAKEPIAEYAQLLEGRGAAAPAAYDWVRRAAAARRAPAEITTADVNGVPVLLFTQNAERAMLMVQAYGNDLYLGWTMWRARSSATMLIHFLRDTFGRLGSGPRYSAELRAASTRALRESVHSLAREGVLAAVHARDVEAGPARPGTGPVERPPESYPGSHAGSPSPGHGERGPVWPDPSSPSAVPGSAPSRTSAPGDDDAAVGSHPDPVAARTASPVAPPSRGELPPPAPAWNEHDLYRPRREPEPIRRAERGSDDGWGPPPR